MIKKLKSFAKKLNLTQQLVFLVLVAMTFFLTVFFGYINYNIDNYIEKQLFSHIHDSQSIIVSNQDVKIDSRLLVFNEKTGIIHLIYHADSHHLEWTDKNTQLSGKLCNSIVNNVQTQIEKEYDYTYKEDKIVNYYTVYKYQDNEALVSVIADDYRKQMREQMTTSIVSTLLIAFGLLWILLIIWVFSIIYSLSLLSGYVNRIRRGEDAVLEMDRSDEIGELADALVKMNEELNRQNQAKEEMIHNISHDLKTPIATIKSYAESIKDGIYPYDTLEKSVDVIIEHSERLEKKVQNLLLLNRVGYIVTSSETGNTDLEKIIDSTLLSIKLIRPEVEIIKITEPAVYFGDEEPWRVVVENLLDNALRYAESQITIYLDQEEMSIENDGPHIDMDNLEKLFKPFEKGTDGKFGLGLSIVSKVVSAYNCNITAYNTNEGVIFKVTKKPSVKKKEQNTKKRGKIR